MEKYLIIWVGAGLIGWFWPGRGFEVKRIVGLLSVVMVWHFTALYVLEKLGL